MKRVVASLALALVAISATAGETKAAKRPVRIFLLSGQSNMTGRGTLGDLNKPAEDQKATLVRFIKAPENVEKYKGLYNGANKTRDGWTIRDDVFIIAGAGTDAAHGGLKPGYGGFRNKGFGPELGIGHVLGDRYEEPILLVKVAFGACSLAVDFRPPSSGGQVGEKYSLAVEALRGAVQRLPELVPGYTKEQGHKIAGFFWNQGEHDSSEKFAPEYEKNLANLIMDLRKEFNAPDMKAVIAVTGAGGWDAADKWRKTVQDTQLAIAKRPELKGNAAATETRDFYRPQEKFGGNKQGIHWHGNGESYWLMGEAMGKAMVELLKDKK